MRRCPYCAEEIQDEAIKCRFCGEFLKKKSRWKGCLIGCLLAFFASILLIVLSVYLAFVALKFMLYKLFFVQPHSSQYYFPPFFGQGIEGAIRDVLEGLKAFWERFLGANQKLTF